MLIGYWGVYSYVFTTPYFGGVVFFHTAKPLLQADDVFLWSVFAHCFLVNGDWLMGLLGYAAKTLMRL